MLKHLIKNYFLLITCYNDIVEYQVKEYITIDKI